MRIVVTGANRGIGAEMTRQLRARGDDVTATARNAENCVPLDVTDPAQIKAFAESLSEPLDLLVCNAGIYLDKGHALDTGYDPELWAQTFAVNVTGVFLAVQALLPALRKSEHARIAIISSQMGSSQRAGNGSYIYRASKAAAANLARNLAADLAAEGIAVGAYHPGWVQTDMGGAAADIDAATSAAGLIARFDALGPDHTGVFENYDGAELPF